MEYPITADKMNDENQKFWDKISLDHFIDFAKITSFKDGKDIDVVYPLIEDMQTVAELGAGYGRGIRFILQKGFKGRLVAIERIQQFVDELKHIEGAEVLKSDIRYLELGFKVDAFLWLWSGILELSKEEQKDALRHCKRFLKKDGIFIVDIPDRKVSVMGKHLSEQMLTLERSWGTLNAFLPMEADMREAAEYAGLELLEPLRYTLKGEANRALYLFKKTKD